MKKSNLTSSKIKQGNFTFRKLKHKKLTKIWKNIDKKSSKNSKNALKYLTNTKMGTSQYSSSFDRKNSHKERKHMRLSKILKNAYRTQIKI